MSGIYIPGISMPEDGWHKVIKIFSDGTVVSYYDSTELGKAIPVPAHGRLGDLDDVINDVRHYLCEGCSDYFGPDAKTESCDYCRGTMLIKAIERKSSIIPADKEGEG